MSCLKQMQTFFSIIVQHKSIPIPYYHLNRSWRHVSLQIILPCARCRDRQFKLICFACFVVLPSQRLKAAITCFCRWLIGCLANRLVDKFCCCPTESSVLQSPVFTKQPGSIVYPVENVEKNREVVFSCEAEGSPPPMYRWVRDCSPLSLSLPPLPVDAACFYTNDSLNIFQFFDIMSQTNVSILSSAVPAAFWRLKMPLREDCGKTRTPTNPEAHLHFCTEQSPDSSH